MIRKIRSILDGNPTDVLNLKLKKYFDFKYKKFDLSKIKIDKNYIYDTPIIINSMNRLSYLKEQIFWLEKCGLKKIIIIDNQSTFVPLIEYYKKIKYPVIRNQTNEGYLSLWKNSIFENIRKNFYVYTDPDIVGINKCPSDFIEYFYEKLISIDTIDKIGFSLNINNIDTTLDLKFDISKNELKFWEKKYFNHDLFIAPIDTTFALYKPNCYGGYWLKSCRTNYPYIAEHLPWTESEYKEENLFYEKNIESKNSFYQSRRNKNY